MQTGYGPALLLGVLIGGSILLDDVITPERKGNQLRVALFHLGDGFEIRRLCPGGDHNVWVIKGDDPSRLRFIRKSESFGLRKGCYGRAATDDLRQCRRR